MNISVIVTVKNDVREVKKLQQALSRQTRKPDEVIIVRAEDHENCSRGEGRNIGIRQAMNDVIAVTDAGCTPHRDWLEKLTDPFLKVSEGSDLSSAALRSAERSDPFRQPLVVAGFYNVIAKTTFQQAIAPYLAVFPDQWSKRYLPASRSIAFTKHAWELVGGYPENAKSGAEDLVFADRLAKHPDINLIHAPDAIVDWEPPRRPSAFFIDMVKHTRGNLEVRYWPHLVKNYSVLLRWIVFLLVPWLIPLYLLWPIVKHNRSARSLQTIILLPFIQLLADSAVIIALFW